MRPLGPGDTMRRENRAVAEGLVKPNDRLSSTERLQIYNQQYWWRLAGSFAEDFRGLRAVLGERKFQRLSTAYLHDAGSRSWNLRDLGSRLVDYLGAHPGGIEPYGRLAIEMAKVEWARVVAFDGGQWPLLDPVAFAKLRPARMKLALQPYLSLLELEYPVDRLLRRLKRTESAAASNAVSEGARPRRLRLIAGPAPAPVHLVVHRLEGSVYYKRIEAPAYRLLESLQRGLCLEAACGIAFAGSGESTDEIAAEVRGWFTAWMSFGWLCDAGRKRVR